MKFDAEQYYHQDMLLKVFTVKIDTGAVFKSFNPGKLVITIFQNILFFEEKNGSYSLVKEFLCSNAVIKKENDL